MSTETGEAELPDSDNRHIAPSSLEEAARVDITFSVLVGASEEDPSPERITLMLHPESLTTLRAMLLQLHAEGLAWSPGTSAKD